jgi:hypothetical protein
MGEATKADTVGNHTLLKRGARGRDVADLQERLRQAGYEPGEQSPSQPPAPGPGEIGSARNPGSARSPEATPSAVLQYSEDPDLA